MDGTKSYDINFFKPSTPFLKENVKVIIIGLIIWGVAVYGFQTLLKLIETPTPEKGYTVYEQVYPKMAQGSASLEEKKSIAKVYLTLIGKAVPLQKNEALKGVLTATIYDLLPDGQKQQFIAATAQIATEKKVDLSAFQNALGIQNDLALKGALPYALTKMDAGKAALVNPAIPPIMDKYLIHNQSVLTDTIFLGFPFHYFYTAVFLLVLFVMICLVYCQVIDRLMKKYEMEQSFE